MVQTVSFPANEVVNLGVFAVLEVVQFIDTDDCLLDNGLKLS